MLDAGPHYPCQQVELATAIEIWLAGERDSTNNLNFIFKWWDHIADVAVAARQRTIVLELFTINDRLWRLENPGLAEVMAEEAAVRLRIEKLCGQPAHSSQRPHPPLATGGAHDCDERGRAVETKLDRP